MARELGRKPQRPRGPRERRERPGRMGATEEEPKGAGPTRRCGLEGAGQTQGGFRVKTHLPRMVLRGGPGLEGELGEKRDGAPIHLRIQLAEGRPRAAEQTQLQVRQKSQGQ